MTQIRLKVIPKPDPAARLILRVASGGLRGAGPIDLLCGLCDSVLAEGVPDAQLRHLRTALVRDSIARGGAVVSGAKEPVVLRCPECESYNEAK